MWVYALKALDIQQHNYSVYIVRVSNENVELNVSFTRKESDE